MLLNNFIRGITKCENAASLPLVGCIFNCSSDSEKFCSYDYVQYSSISICIKRLEVECVSVLDYTTFAGYEI